MKKTVKYILSAALTLLLAACGREELDTNQFGEGVRFSAMAPNPVMRGGELRIVGSNLDQVTEVRFAGGVTVTDIQVVKQGTPGEIRVQVPLEGPEVGPVEIVGKDGVTSRSFADLTFTEPIEVESFTPATVLSGDVLTFKGEYLNDVKEVIFSGEDAVSVTFESQSRHELKVKVPANAVSGPVILSDVNELEDANSIPNHIYAKTDLAVGNPTVVKAANAVYKSGDLITVKGAHLDMIRNVSLPQVSEVDFTVSADATTITFNLPPKASDGSIILTSYAGVDFEAGLMETVSVTDLGIVSKAEDQRYKAGCEVEITGSDLDLVTKVEFTGAEASWYLDKGKIIATQPAAAKDGPVTVTLDSGKQAYSEDIEVVKPVFESRSEGETWTAGQQTIEIFGEDLDLVETVKMGNKAQSFIPCEFEFKTDGEGKTVVSVMIPDQAYSSAIILTSAAGYETVTDALTVVYDEAVSIKFDEPSFGLGKNISVTGKNLLQVEQVFIKGKKVVSYANRADDAMAFAIPDGIGPGVYRLALVLVDGAELTWPVPFEITAPFTETFIWEGHEDLGSWGPQPYLGADGALADGGLEIGDVMRIYYTHYADGWQFEIFGGHWEGMSFPELDGGKAVKSDNQDPDAQYFAFEVTEANYGILTSAAQGWGGVLVVQGESVIITGLSIIHFGAAEKRTTIWEGSVTVGDWDGSMGALSWGGYDWSTVQAGTKLAVSFTTSSDDAVMRFGNGNWASLPSLAGLAKEGNLPIAGLTSYEFELTQEDLADLVANGGLVICGAFWTITEVALVTMESAGPQEKTIWEGSVQVWWGDAGSNALSALAYGGFDWSTVEAGTILCAHYTIDEGVEGGCIRFGNGSWASIPSLSGLAQDGNLPLVDGGVHEVELTADDLAFLVANDGMVICGNGYTITSVGLK
jgi:hypothetical protein